MTTLGEMACGIIHEINNPLSIILSRLSIVNHELKTNSTPDLDFIQESFNTIETAAQRMRGITKALGAYARNATSDPMCRIHIVQIMKQLEEICRSNFRSHSVELRFNTDAMDDLYVMGRPAQLLQVFLNILSNALDAVKGQEAPWVAVVGNRVGAKVILKFTDSSAGIAPEIVSRIMQPFYTTKKLGEGTGLGLSISKGIIDEHNGSLIYESSSLNTCFVVELPFH
jgi:C4-dicarboxylate-specific signal transduction histidine kinase